MPTVDILGESGEVNQGKVDANLWPVLLFPTDEKARNAFTLRLLKQGLAQGIENIKKYALLDTTINTETVTVLESLFIEEVEKRGLRVMDLVDLPRVAEKESEVDRLIWAGRLAGQVLQYIVWLHGEGRETSIKQVACMVEAWWNDLFSLVADKALEGQDAGKRDKAKLINTYARRFPHSSRTIEEDWKKMWPIAPFWAAHWDGYDFMAEDALDVMLFYSRVIWYQRKGSIVEIRTGIMGKDKRPVLDPECLWTLPEQYRPVKGDFDHVKWSNRDQILDWYELCPER